MVKRRKLTSKEAELTEKNVERLRSELTEQVSNLHQAEQWLDEGITASVIRVTREWEQKKKMSKDNIEQITFSLSTCEDQLKNGVIIKKEE